MPKPRRAIEQDMIERLAALARGGDQNSQVLFHPFLPDQITQYARADVLIHTVFGLGQGVNETRSGFFRGVAGSHKLDYNEFPVKSPIQCTRWV